MKPGSIQPNQHLFFVLISTESLFFIQQIVLVVMLLIMGLGLAGGNHQPAYALAYAESNQRNPEEEKACPEENQALSYIELTCDEAQEPLNKVPDKGITKAELEAEKELVDAGIEINQPQDKIGPLVVRSVPNAHNMVALTFDDGPFPRWTEYYVQVLGLYGIPATFFVTGQQAHAYPEGIQTILSAGHEIANHSFSHKRFTSLQEKDVRWELSSTNQVLEQASGIAPTLFRPPYGSFNQHVVDLAWEHGMRTVTWSLDPQDWRKPGVEDLVKTVVSKAKAGDIILLHEGKVETLFALSMIIAGIQEKGLEFVSVSTLLEKSQ
ncbi:MAG: polysaccharide deacetylase family protein [Bacillota bacterium]